MTSWWQKMAQDRAPLTRTLQWLVLAVIFFMIDQGSKWWALSHLSPDHVLQPLPGLQLFLTHNRGVAFSFLAEQGMWAQLFLLSISAFVSILLIALVSKQSERSINKYALMLILGGALGNAYDRIQMSAVLDFITLEVGQWHWPTVFNIADIFITAGCIILLCTFNKTKKPGEALPEQNNTNA